MKKDRKHTERQESLSFLAFSKSKGDRLQSAVDNYFFATSYIQPKGAFQSKQITSPPAFSHLIKRGRHRSKLRDREDNSCDSKNTGLKNCCDTEDVAPGIVYDCKLAIHIS